MPLFLGVDVGTQSCKCVVWDSDRKSVAALGQKAYDVMSSRPGQAEQNPSTWKQAVQEATLSALEAVDRTQVAAIGVSGQQHGLVPLDASGDVIRPAKLWCDVESAPQAEQISEALGYKLVPSFTATKIKWLADNEPENFDRLDRVLLPHDYINFWLTGSMVMECGDASGTGVFDTANRVHDAAAIDTVFGSGHQDLFPPLIQPNDAIGTVTSDVAELLRIPASTIVAPGSGDNMMSALGVGAVAHGDLVVSLGTSGTLFCPSDTPVLDPEGQIAPFCDATGRWLPLMCTMNCTVPPDEVRTAFSLSTLEATRLASSEAPGCEGVNMLPYLIGERTPDWPRSTAAILGLTPGALQRPGLLYRAALEGSTFSLAGGIARLESFGVSPTCVRLVGGGSKNPLWRQIVADVLGRPVSIPRVAESAALGGALQAAAVFSASDVGQFVKENEPEAEEGVVQPIAQHVEAYAAALERHRRAGVALFSPPLTHIV